MHKSLDTIDTGDIHKMDLDQLKQYALAVTEAMFDTSLSNARKTKLRERRFTAETLFIRKSVDNKNKK